MTKYCFVKIHSTFQIYKIIDAIDCAIGDDILVEMDANVERARVTDSKEFPQAELKEDWSALRVLSDDDKLKLSELKLVAKETIKKCQDIVKSHNLPMRILDADFSFDVKKLTFYFASESRVDFRELVSDLAHNFHKLIRLQQIGARNQAKILGGFGKCGRSLCCCGWLKDLDSVTLDMAKDQGISAVGASKVSGICGKLMCCLAYELDENNYDENHKTEARNNISSNG